MRPAHIWLLQQRLPAPRVLGVTTTLPWSHLTQSCLKKRKFRAPRLAQRTGRSVQKLLGRAHAASQLSSDTTTSSVALQLSRTVPQALPFVWPIHVHPSNLPGSDLQNLNMEGGRGESALKCGLKSWCEAIEGFLFFLTAPSSVSSQL